MTPAVWCSTHKHGQAHHPAMSTCYVGFMSELLEGPGHTQERQGCRALRRLPLQMIVIVQAVIADDSDVSVCQQSRRMPEMWHVGGITQTALYAWGVSVNQRLQSLPAAALAPCSGLPHNNNLPTSNTPAHTLPLSPSARHLGERSSQAYGAKRSKHNNMIGFVTTLPGNSAAAPAPPASSCGAAACVVAAQPPHHHRPAHHLLSQNNSEAEPELKNTTVSQAFGLLPKYRNRFASYFGCSVPIHLSQ